MKAFKDGKYLVFRLEDNREVRYDLSDGTFIGFSGKKVKNIKDQLKGYDILDIIDSFEDEVYKSYLNKVYDLVSCKGGSYILNFGTFLERLRRYYMHFEQYYTAGITNLSDNLRYKISDVPSGLLKIVKDTNIVLSNALVREYVNNPDLFNMMYEFKAKHLTNQDKFDIITDIVHGRTDFNTLVEKYNYNPATLIKYVDSIMHYEGIRYHSTLLRELKDYCRMSTYIGRDGKFEKYPRNFLTVHNITVRNYNRLIKTYDHKAFAKCFKPEMEFTFGDYVFIYPKSVDDIKLEAVSLSHCVASYIEDVINGKCDIIFLRHKNSPEDSLLTLEVIDNEVTHSAGLFNREPNKKEKIAIEFYNEYLGGK